MEENILKNILTSSDTPQSAKVILDDILIGAGNKEKLFELSDKVLAKLDATGGKLNPSKCEFGVTKVKYYGHVISGDGVSVDSEKIESIKNVPAPKTKTELKSFFGLVHYYGKFCSNLSTIAAPLNALLKNNVPFVWSTRCQEAFDRIKEILASAPVLAHYCPKKKLYLQCDASPFGLGVVMSQTDEVSGKEHPIAFANRSLSNTERNYAQIDREALAIIYGVQKFQKYLLGREFVLVTDHKPLLRILGEKYSLPSLASARLSRWAVYLSQYRYQIVFKDGRSHSNADALSRFPAPEEENRADIAEQFYIRQIRTLPVCFKDIQEASSNDDTLSKVYARVKNGWEEKCSDQVLLPFFKRRNELSLQGNVVLWGRRVVIPECQHQAVLDQLHEHHPGVVRMKQLARMYCWWPKISDDIERRVNVCQTCIQHQNMPAKADVLPWPPSESPWHRVHIDYANFMGKSFLILVDSYSKWIEVGVTRADQMSSKRTIEMLRNWFARFGYPKVIVSDNGTQFKSTEFMSFAKSIGAKQKFSAPGHPATNGQAERIVQTFKKGMRKIFSETPDKNVQAALDKMLFGQRFTPCTVTGRSPAELFLGRQIRNELSVLQENNNNNSCFNPEKQTTNFNKGDRVLIVTDLASKIREWKEGVVEDVIGLRHYIVKIGEMKYKRHENQIRKKKF